MVNERTSIHSRFLEAWSKGLTQSQIAKVLVVSRQRCAELHKLNGKIPHGCRDDRPRIIRERRASVRHQHGKGLTQVAIARTLGLSKSTVQKDLSDMGLTTTSAAVAARRKVVASLVAKKWTGP